MFLMIMKDNNWTNMENYIQCGKNTKKTRGLSFHNMNVLFVICIRPLGYFTAPVSGKYFFSGILTGHKNLKIEAVLSKSNSGVARVDSAGYQPEGLEKPMAEAKHIPGALAVFNVILPMKVGDTVCIDLVTGKLAFSSEPLTIFSGMLLYESK